MVSAIVSEIFFREPLALFSLLSSLFVLSSGNSFWLLILFALYSQVLVLVSLDIHFVVPLEHCFVFSRVLLFFSQGIHFVALHWHCFVFSSLASFKSFVVFCICVNKLSHVKPMSLNGKTLFWQYDVIWKYLTKFSKPSREVKITFQMDKAFYVNFLSENQIF